MKHVVGIAKEALGPDDLRHVQQGGFEGLNGIAAAFPESGKGDGREGQTDLGRVDMRRIVPDDTGLFQRSHASVARRQAQSGLGQRLALSRRRNMKSLSASRK